jgi:hypothetical protein
MANSFLIFVLAIGLAEGNERDYFEKPGDILHPFYAQSKQSCTRRGEHRRMYRMKRELKLHCLDQLAADPAILRGLMCDLSVEDTAWKPAPAAFR